MTRPHPPTLSLRAEAARALLTVDQGTATLGSALEQCAASLTDPRDRALAVEMVTGTLRWRAELDALIAFAARRAASTIDASSLAVLRLGAYQLRHLDRVPDHAVVSESVNAVREIGEPRAAGFINAVLRSMIRRGAAFSMPKRPKAGEGAALDAQVAYLSLAGSHPAWLVRRWIARYGFEATVAWCAYNNHSPDITARAFDGRSAAALTEWLATEGIVATPSRFLADAVRLPHGTLSHLSPAARESLWIQDEGAQLVARAAGVMPGERVLDLCASPGGKSNVMAADLGHDHAGLLVASDYRSPRVTLLAHTVRRLPRAVPVVRLDARHPLPFGATFDVVLVDAPCSGLGTLRREPDLKWSRQPGQLADLAQTALEILRHAAQAVRPGGRLVYATCSSEPDENQAVIDTFLGETTAFRRGPLGAAIPNALRDDDGAMVTRPDRDDLDAYYTAVLVRARGA